MEEEAQLTCATQEQPLSLSERQCRCTCLHSGGDSGFFSGWGAVQCFEACVPISSDCLGSKTASKEYLSGTAEGLKAGGAKVPPAGKRRASGARSAEDKPRHHPLMSRSVPSLTSQNLYNVRGAEVCYLQPHEQALYYRQKVTYDAARKADVVHTHLPPKRKREAMPITPQVATKGPGLQITPVHKPYPRSMELQGTANADSTLLQQADKRATAAKNCMVGSKSCGGGTKKKQEQDSRVSWAHSIKVYKNNYSTEGEVSKDGRSTKRPVMLQGRMKHQFKHCRLKMLQYRPDLKAYVRGAGWLEEEEEVCNMPALLDSSGSSESLLSHPLKCFPLGPSAPCKDQKQETGCKKPEHSQNGKKKQSKDKNASRPGIPALGNTVHGVVFNSQQPANLLQHRCQVSFMGMQQGFRYETLCLKGFGRNSSPQMVVGPWITASPRT